MCVVVMLYCVVRLLLTTDMDVNTNGATSRALNMLLNTDYSIAKPKLQNSENFFASGGSTVIVH